jgi:hypothetical protein
MPKAHVRSKENVLLVLDRDLTIKNIGFFCVFLDLGSGCLYQ